MNHLPFVYPKQITCNIQGRGRGGAPVASEVETKVFFYSENFFVQRVACCIAYCFSGSCKKNGQQNQVAGQDSLIRFATQENFG